MKRFISIAKIHSSVGMTGCSVVWSKMVRNAPAGCGKAQDIFSSFTIKAVSNMPEAMCCQAWITVITPVPPPT